MQGSVDLNQNNQKPSQVPYVPDDAQNPGKKLNAVTHLRTYTNDVAELIRDKKLSPQELAKIDPKIVKVAQAGGMPDDVVIVEHAEPLRTPKTDPLTEQLLKMKDEARAEIGNKAKADEVKVEREAEQDTAKVRGDGETFDLNAAEKEAEGKTQKYDEIEKIKELPKKVEPKIEAKKPEEFKMEVILPSTPKPKPVEPKPVEPVAKPVEPKPIPPPPPPKPIPPPPPPPPAPKELSEAEKLTAQKTKVEADLAQITAEKKKVQDSKTDVLQQRMSVETEITPLKTKEQDVESRESEIWNKVAQAVSAADKRVAETERWNLEDERERIESERWAMDQRILSFEKQIAELAMSEASLLKKETAAKSELDMLKKQEVALAAKAEKSELMNKLNEIKNSRTQLETEWKNLIDKKKKAEAAEAELEKTQEAVRGEFKAVDTKEHSTSDPIMVHELEMMRAEKDKKLRALEAELWKLEEQEGEANKLVEDVEKRSEQVLFMEKTTKSKIAELDKLINFNTGPVS